MKKLNNYIIRDYGVLTGKNFLEPLFKLENFPVFFGCVNTPIEEDLFADMHWSIDTETGIVQLTKLIPPKILYKEQHVDGIGKTWQDYYDYFSQYIVNQNPKSILEIGGGSGQIADRVIKLNMNVKCLIVEPNPTYKENDRVTILSSFFNQDLSISNVEKENIDTIVFSQVWEHSYDPIQFMDDIDTFLKIGDKLIFAYPDLELWLKRKYTNALNFEHTMLLTEKHIDALLTHYNFKVLNKTHYKEHSFLYTLKKHSGPIIKEPIPNLYTKYKGIFNNFIIFHKNEVDTINKNIELSKNPIYIFGAHIFTTYLIAFGLNITKVESILDNSETKQGKRLYGTNIIVQSPEILKNEKTPILILKAGIYNNEIKNQILSQINSNTIFWE